MNRQPNVFRKPIPRVDDRFGCDTFVALGDDMLVAVQRDDTKGPDAGAAYFFDGSSALRTGCSSYRRASRE
jgi:hypothetical protein